MGAGFRREIFYYKHYYTDFFETLNEDVKLKLNWTLQLIATQERIPEKFLKHIGSRKGLYEIRVEYASNIFRVFSFFDDGRLIILLNGFQKKTQKTPASEIKMAEKLRKEYLHEKEK